MARTLLLKDPLRLLLGPLRVLLRMLLSRNGTASNHCSAAFTASQARRRVAETFSISPRLSGRTLWRSDVPCKLAHNPTRSSPACSPGSRSATTSLKVSNPFDNVYQLANNQQEMSRASSARTSFHHKGTIQAPGFALFLFLISIAHYWRRSRAFSGAPEAHTLPFMYERD